MKTHGFSLNTAGVFKPLFFWGKVSRGSRLTSHKITFPGQQKNILGFHRFYFFPWAGLHKGSFNLKMRWEPFLCWTYGLFLGWKLAIGLLNCRCCEWFFFWVCDRWKHTIIWPNYNISQIYQPMFPWNKGTSPYNWREVVFSVAIIWSE